MAVVTCGNSGVNAFTENVSTQTVSTSISTTSLEVTFANGSKTIYTGNFLVMNGQLYGGTITGRTGYLSNGQLEAAATGLNVDLASYSYYASINDARGLNNLYFGGNDTFIGGTGNDTFIQTAGSDVVNGGAGRDTIVFDSIRSAYQAIRTSGGEIQVSGIGSTATCSQVERFVFSDSAFAFDGTAAASYRLYQAAFDRQPDASGLGYWIAQVDKGLSLYDTAWNFLNSAEFKTLYGADISNATYINALYDNVLHRAPDKAGLDYWTDMLATGKISRHGMLAEFSESPENQAQVIGSIQNGIVYTPFI